MVVMGMLAQAKLLPWPSPPQLLVVFMAEEAGLLDGHVVPGPPPMLTACLYTPGCLPDSGIPG